MGYCFGLRTEYLVGKWKVPVPASQFEFASSALRPSSGYLLCLFCFSSFSFSSGLMIFELISIDC